MILYHGTASANLDAIKAQGLIPRGNHGSDDWAIANTKFGEGMKLAMERNPDRAHSVYLTSDPERALDFAELAAAMLRSKPVVLKVELPEGEKLVPDENATGEGMRHLGPIPPNDIIGPVKVKITNPWRLPFDFVMKGDDP